MDTLKGPNSNGSEPRDAPKDTDLASMIGGIMGDLAQPVRDEEMPPDPDVHSEAIERVFMEQGRAHLDYMQDRQVQAELTRYMGTGVLDYVYRKGQRLLSVGIEGMQVFDGPRLAAHINDKITLRKFSKNGDDFQLPLFKDSSAKQIAAAPELCPNVRDVKAVTVMPMFRPDGSLLHTHGFDAATGYMFLPSDDFMPVPEKPTAAQIHAARALVLTPLAGFPFELGNDGRAGWIGLALTPLLDQIITGDRKLGLFDANQSNSGKSFLAKMCNVLYGGEPQSMPDTDAEMRKTITAQLMGTAKVITFDNVRGRINFPSLEVLLTSRTWADRKLGVSEISNLVNDRLWLMTANNASIGGDLNRRVLHVRLHTGPNPDARPFSFNPEEWMIAHRLDYFAALCTLVSAWVAEGMPVPTGGRTDSFAPWRNAVNGILAVADIEGTFDPEGARIESDEDMECRVFIEALQTAFGDREWVVKDVDKALSGGTLNSEDLPTYLAEKYGAFGNRIAAKLSWWLKDRKGRYFGTIAVDSRQDRTRKQTVWKVVEDQ